ncbi:MAG: type I glyceraldehyde-3-phosphate dehydrogenase [Chloroflexi bacterium]|nr:type I glyceraldehyde-3-phosphate dehydrogenase [Chloroflexota bacterium]
MMSVKVGINGFGRVGRQVLKILRQEYRDDFQVVAINARHDAETKAHLLRYDSIYGRYPESVQVSNGNILVGGDAIASFSQRDPSGLPWRQIGVELVIESTGVILTGGQASEHIDAGAKRVIITAPAKDEDATIVMGVNDADYDPQRHRVVSNASCTTNCLAPVAKVLHDRFGILKGLMTTVHSYTNDQSILDRSHRDLRRARAAATNIIPTSTGAAAAVAKVIPDLAGKFDGYALRVPTPAVSIVDFAVVVARDVTNDEVRQAFREAAEGPMRGILGYEEEPLVSSDFRGDPRSSIVDAQLVQVRGGNLVKVVAWYDNEWGYCARVADLAKLMKDQGI